MCHCLGLTSYMKNGSNNESRSKIRVHALKLHRAVDLTTAEEIQPIYTCISFPILHSICFRASHIYRRLMGVSVISLCCCCFRKGKDSFSVFGGLPTSFPFLLILTTLSMHFMHLLDLLLRGFPYLCIICNWIFLLVCSI